jgi:protein-S-isoprenylcysteine O-methyltransferase Ste14
MSANLALALLFSVGWIPIFFFRTEPLRNAFEEYGRTERLAVVVTPLVLTVHVMASCVLLSVTPSSPLWRTLASAGLFAAGLGFWFWARATIGPLRVRRTPDQPPIEFRRDGPFAFVRNPLYLACLLALSAPAVAAGRPLLIASFALCVLALAVRCRQDERRLHDQLGQTYVDYCRDVKRLIPFLW